jgi:hypothetical protein
MFYFLSINHVFKIIKHILPLMKIDFDCADDFGMNFFIFIKNATNISFNRHHFKVIT